MANSTLAPIALFAYKRPLFTLQTLYTLSRCPEASESELFVYADGPRTAEDEPAVRHTREVIRASPWCGRVNLIESPHNKGLARSVIDGVSEVCAASGRVIVVEDDLLLSRGFLSYMNEALRRYENAPEIMQVSGHAFPVGPPTPRAVILPIATTWGWATWQRAWRLFDEHPADLDRLDRDRAFKRGFDLDGARDYSGIMAAQRRGEIDSWGIRWWWSVYRANGRTVFPLQTLVANIGVGADATHTRDSALSRSLTNAPQWDLDNEIREWPSDLSVDEQVYERWKSHLRSSDPLRQRLLRTFWQRMPGVVRKNATGIKRAIVRKS